MHRLRHYRESYGLTVKELSVLSDISVGAIHRIESGSNPYKTHEGVALALASALDVEVHNLFNKSELSHLGRPPHTGRPIARLYLVEDKPDICPDCHYEYPVSRICGICAA